MENVNGLKPNIVVQQAKAAAEACNAALKSDMNIGDALNGKAKQEKEVKSGKDFNKEMKADFKEAENRLKESGLKGKELKSALNAEKENIRAQYCEKGFISYDNSQAWLKQKMADIKEANPEMSKKELKQAAKDAFKEQFGIDAPKAGFIRKFGNYVLMALFSPVSSVLAVGGLLTGNGVGDKIADAHDNSRHKQYEVRA